MSKKILRLLRLAIRQVGIAYASLTGKRKKQIRDSCRTYATETSVIDEVHPRDHIFGFLIENPSFPSLDAAVKQYFYGGQESAEILAQLLFSELGLVRSPESTLLEFASGYGRVTRHLPLVLRPMKVFACDIHAAACEFMEHALATRAIPSSTRPEDLAIESNSYDVVFALSFFSHMPESTWSRWLVSLFDKVEPGGHLIFTTQGQKSRKYFGDPVIPESGIWHIPSSEQKDLDSSDYGNTIVTREFVESVADRYLDQPITLFKEAYWWEHQDLYVFRKSDLALTDKDAVRHAGCEQIG